MRERVIRALPAKVWHEQLDPKGKAEFKACMENIATAFMIGRRTDRITVLGHTKNRWMEVRVTVRGKKARPVLRALALRRQMTLWLAIGFMKHGDKIEPRHIADADGVRKVWIGEAQ
jgi:hypothetical protein